MAKKTAKVAIDRSKLPLPEPPFKGVIRKSYVDSKQDWPAVPKPPEGAPNVVVILLDDVGFGQISTFGGPVPTPELDKLAAQGLRYNRFHTTAICGPSPAALITGRNHHALRARRQACLPLQLVRTRTDQSNFERSASGRKIDRRDGVRL